MGIIIYGDNLLGWFVFPYIIIIIIFIVIIISY